MSNLPSDVEEDLAYDEVDGCFPSNDRPKAFGKYRGVCVPCSDQIDSGVFASVSDDGYNSTSIGGVDTVQNLFRGLQVTDSVSNEVITDSISLNNKVKSSAQTTHCSNSQNRNEQSSSPVQESCSVVSHSAINEALKNKLDIDRFDSGCCSESIDLFPRSETKENVEPTNLNSEEYALQFYQADEDGDTDLHNSIIQLNNELSHQLISIVPTYDWLNFQNRLSQTPLHLAVLTNQPEIVRRLMVGGAQIDIRDHKGDTPLHIASQKGYQEIAKLLLTPVFHYEIKVNGYEIPYQKIPQDLEIRNYDGLSCLHLAALGNHYGSMRLLLENRAPINIADGKSGRTILHYAAEQGNESLLKFILSSPNTDMNKKTYGGLTAIVLANGRGYYDAVRFLYTSGADTAGLDENQDDSDEEMDTMYDDIEINGERVFT